ncbi:MAG: plasmid replication protein RepC [Pseudomonadota bacterium]
MTTTPFGRRPVTAGLMDQIRQAAAPADIPHTGKWALFRELCAARLAFGVSDRDLTVLNALLSFHRADTLSDNDNLVVFPSNAALSERAHGMAESTLRRHLAALIQAGLILRHDSPNGKRYATRGIEGEITRAFGFDLRPLLVQAQQIARAASETRAARENLRRLREEVSLLKRDALKLVVYGADEGLRGDWATLEASLLAIHKQMRRKLSFAELDALKADLSSLMQVVQTLLKDPETEKMSGSDADIERHHSNSNEDSLDLELSGKPDQVEPVRPAPSDTVKPNLPLALVLKACPDITEYARDPVRNWHDLVALAGFVRGMMGISPDAWAAAQDVMGPETAAITVAGILQRVDQIRSPGGYLRSLTAKSAQGGFSPGPMIMALLAPPVVRAS